MSSSVPRQRLTELIEACIVKQEPGAAYPLTQLGQGAYRALRPLVRWSDDWARALADGGLATEAEAPT
ncbi:hypothetical protein [Micromonospora sp. NPDC005087]|uniref:hypothetical protein n=1 Tax=Micromonospora sp. NPDC005087 TaxID=3364225 RepID=UPI0036B82116